MAGRKARDGCCRAAVAALALVLAGLLALPAAQAQMGPGGMSAPLLNGGKASQFPKARPAPMALPGARHNQVVAPAPVSPSSMNPSAALFDAINRNDVAAARDALNRGASLQAHNVLGMTPLQLSIDLGRNNITFLLLSMRGGESAPPPAVAATQGAGGGLTRRPHAATGPREAQGHRPKPVARPVATPAPGVSPERVAGNGGTPVPSAGFLGFDPGH